MFHLAWDMILRSLEINGDEYEFFGMFVTSSLTEGGLFQPCF